MQILNRCREIIKQLAFGSATVPQQCAIGLRDPQMEISVRLHGFGPSRDVTDRNVIAAARPFTLGIGLDEKRKDSVIDGASPSLEFRERHGQQRLLGKIYLGAAESLPFGEHGLYLFRARSCSNYCLPRARLWARYLQYDYEQWRRSRRSVDSSLHIPPHELHSLFVFYICPRPVVLVSVVDREIANIFPMDLIGSIAPGYFSLALHSTSSGVPLIERSRRVALSSIPVEQTCIAYELGKNHKRAGIEWNRLPFNTRSSPEF